MTRKVLRRVANLLVPLSTAIVLATSLSFLLSGCGPRTIGFGVLLWSQDESLVRSGSVVPVISESELNDVYQFAAGEEIGEVEIERWRLQFFETIEAAEAYARESAVYATMYANSTRNALPMRSERSLDQENIVYRLRLDETIKVIGRDSEQTNLSGLVSYWFLALTEGGVRAYVFGYELSLFDPFDSSVAEQQRGATDPLVELLLTNTWRPIYFVDMIRSGAIDLTLFRPEYGLFPRPDENALELVMPYHTTEFRYDRIADVGPRKYLAEGTSLQLTFRINDELSLQYLLDGRQYSLAMQRVSGDIAEIVEAEIERRSEIYDTLVDSGPVYSSGNYGTIQFLDDQRFKWALYDRLEGAVIPTGAGPTGRVDLGLFLSEELSEEYDGGLSLLFDAIEEPVSFVYIRSIDGIRLVYVSQTDIDEQLVTRVGTNALTIFFSSSGG